MKGINRLCLHVVNTVFTWLVPAAVDNDKPSFRSLVCENQG